MPSLQHQTNMASPIFTPQYNLPKHHFPPPPTLPRIPKLSKSSIPFSTKSPFYPPTWAPRKTPSLHCSNSPEEAEVLGTEDEWLHKLPDRKKPLYSHSLPCIESWLKSLNFYQSKEDRSLWFVQHPHWHAQLSLDITDLYIRYLKTGPGILEKDVERRFSYALSREDIENAILGGP